PPGSCSDSCLLLPNTQSEAAAADLERAAQLAPKSPFVQRNKAALEYSHHELARVDVASK
ncbi:MAG TPA: hypothetical protein VGI23_25980, partial [Steroidobacteraceae bacterium]